MQVDKIYQRNIFESCDVWRCSILLEYSFRQLSLFASIWDEKFTPHFWSISVLIFTCSSSFFKDARVNPSRHSLQGNLESVQHHLLSLSLNLHVLAIHQVIMNMHSFRKKLSSQQVFMFIQCPTAKSNSSFCVALCEGFGKGKFHADKVFWERNCCHQGKLETITCKSHFCISFEKMKNSASFSCSCTFVRFKFS